MVWCEGQNIIVGFNSLYLCVHGIKEYKLQPGPDKAHPEVGLLGESAFNFPIYCRASS